MIDLLLEARALEARAAIFAAQSADLARKGADLHQAVQRFILTLADLRADRQPPAA